MPLPSVKSLQVIAAEKAATGKAQREADYAKFLAEATKAKTKLRCELTAKIEAKILAAPGTGEAEVYAFNPSNTDDYQRTLAYTRVWREVIAAWAATQKRKGYTVTTRTFGLTTLIVKVTWPRS